MVTEKKLKKIADKVLLLSKSQETEVLLSISENSLTRFANNQIHQNVAWRNIGVSLRIIDNKRIGVATTNSFDTASLEKVVEKATFLSQLQKPDEHFVSLPKPMPIPEVDQSIEFATEHGMAKSVYTVIKKAKDASLIASGAYSNGADHLAVANSHGVWAYNQSSSCNLSTIVMGESSSGFASNVSKRNDNIDAEYIAKTAVSKTIESSDPSEIEPGEYEVIFEPQAVSEMLAFLQWYGPNARIYHEGASAFSNKIGNLVFGKNITLIDDPFHKDIFPMPFDYEGVPKKKLTIVENGVLKNIAYDSYNANRFKMPNTGHALPAPNTLGPIPLHMYIKPGSSTREKMIKSVKRGLLVTRLWYVRVLNPKQLNITGMTRDGTFLIENGTIIKPVKNMRFNQSIPQALNNTLAIEDKLTPLASFEGELIGLAPTMHIGSWNFTSATLF